MRASPDDDKVAVGVFCGSGSHLPQRHVETAETLGRELARRGHSLVYGGGDVGLMGPLARAVHAGGGHVIGYIPRRLMAIEGRAYSIADVLHVTETLADRKAGIFGTADAFVVLPGGIGTLEEFLEIVTLRHLGYADQPVVLLDDRGFYRTFLAFLDETVELGFTAGRDRLFRVATTPTDALDLLESELRRP